MDRNPEDRPVIETVHHRKMVYCRHIWALIYPCSNHRVPPPLKEKDDCLYVIAAESLTYKPRGVCTISITGKGSAVHTTIPFHIS